MNFFSRIFRSNFFIKLKSWEYWPFGVLQAPLFLYWLWQSLKSGSIFFFSASNPGILMGGMFGESKFEVLEKLPIELKPRTALVRSPWTVEKVLNVMREQGFAFPVIFKPDLGERGWMVKKISDHQDVLTYLSEIKTDFLIQEFLDLPLEFGVFYVRYPNEGSGKVTSITGKEMLSVRGDGLKTLEALILEKERAKIQWQVLKEKFRSRLAEVIPKGEAIELISIGNHCLGTKFLDQNNLITPQMSDAFDRISKQVPGFYFGRYDLRTGSEQDLQSGRIKVMELNGCGAEPAHIYQPGFSIFNAWKVLFKHWHDIYKISKENHKRGVAYISFNDGRKAYKHFKSVTAA
jgi:hypothetical protein